MIGTNSLHSYKSASRMTDKASMVSNYSKASWTHSRSKERVISSSKCKPRQMQLSSKEEAVGRMGKKPPAAGRSGLVKCKSSGQANLFKR